MAQLVRKLAAAEGRTCRILMDLAGHKIRTGPLEREPAVKHVHVRRNTLGAMVMPGEALIYRKGSAPAGQLSLPDEVFEQLQPDDRLRLVDTRGKKRSLHIVHRMASGPWLAQSKRSAYVAADTPFHWQRADADGGFHTLSEQRFADFPGMSVTIRLHVGDKLLLTASQTPGRAAILNPVGEVMAPASIGCTHPEVVKALKVHDLVWIDDGKLGAVVTAIGPEGALLNIVHAHDKGVTVLAEKGFNFPSTPLNLPPLSQKDLRDLDTVCQLADMVGFSFVESLGDMECLIAALAQRGKPHLPIIAKIETARGVRHLPEILLGTLGRHPLGVMIARGDLAVELGGVRLAEIQEELLWLCEAAHVPVIWATQVLESLAKNGDLSRPEYTDAAMSGRADCVMLNKGPHIIKALSTLSDILQRMQAHQQKKTARLRALHW
ncbi:MAG: pyruvate kinase [Gammaproteobacteria bacterium]|nr:pyruvate kinase [Gammaproteobacteria bacterium]